MEACGGTCGKRRRKGPYEQDFACKVYTDPTTGLPVHSETRMADTRPELGSNNHCLDCNRAMKKAGVFKAKAGAPAGR